MCRQLSKLCCFCLAISAITQRRNAGTTIPCYKELRSRAPSAVRVILGYDLSIFHSRLGFTLAPMASLLIFLVWR